VGIPPSYLLFVDHPLKNAEDMPLNDKRRCSNERCFDYDKKAFLQKWKILNRIFAMARIAV